jgi:hypothetical protein
MVSADRHPRHGVTANVTIDREINQEPGGDDENPNPIPALLSPAVVPLHCRLDGEDGNKKDAISSSHGGQSAEDAGEPPPLLSRAENAGENEEKKERLRVSDLNEISSGENQEKPNSALRHLGREVEQNQSSKKQNRAQEAECRDDQRTRKIVVREKRQRASEPRVERINNKVCAFAIAGLRDRENVLRIPAAPKLERLAQTMQTFVVEDHEGFHAQHEKEELNRQGPSNDEPVILGNATNKLERFSRVPSPAPPLPSTKDEPELFR